MQTNACDAIAMLDNGIAGGKFHQLSLGRGIQVLAAHFRARERRALEERYIEAA